MNFLKKLIGKCIEISLVDRTLIIIMFISMVYLSFNLLADIPNLQEKSGINGVFRTSASAIFGYILSGNFCKQVSGKTRKSNKMQTCFTAVIGLFCLLILIALGLFLPNDQISSDDISTITLVRDFVSGSVGFLIGSPNQE